MQNDNQAKFELPDGVYESKLVDLQTDVDYLSRPVLRTQFEIKKGRYRKFRIYKTFYLTGSYPIHKASEFIRSLFPYERCFTYTNFDNFKEEITEINAEIGDSLEFSVEKSKNDKGFTEIRVVDVTTV